MQPVLVNDTASGRITALLYDNLIQVDYKTGEPQPRLATFSVSSDSLKYTYTIDPKAVIFGMKQLGVDVSAWTGERTPIPGA